MDYAFVAKIFFFFEIFHLFHFKKKKLYVLLLIRLRKKKSINWCLIIALFFVLSMNMMLKHFIHISFSLEYLKRKETVTRKTQNKAMQANMKIIPVLYYLNGCTKQMRAKSEKFNNKKNPIIN